MDLKNILKKKRKTRLSKFSFSHWSKDRTISALKSWNTSLVLLSFQGLHVVLLASLFCAYLAQFSFFSLTVQMLGMMSKNLMNMSVIVVLMAVGFRCSRCAEKLKPCRANIWSPLHTWMSQHNQRNPLDLFQTFLASVCGCCWGK